MGSESGPANFNVLFGPPSGDMEQLDITSVGLRGGVKVEGLSLRI